jgi:putative ABC transport system substrate-binding protein
MSSRLRGRRRALRLCAGVWLAPAAWAAAAENTRGLAVLYPEIAEPFRAIFAKMVEGIEEQLRARVPSYAVGDSAKLPDLAAELRRQDVHVVIALGRNGLKAALSLDREVTIVAGGVLSVSEADARRLTVHSLAPDPVLLFGRLKSLLPGARRVLAIHDPRQNAWLMRRAREASQAWGLDVSLQEADDLKTALRFYQDVFATADPRRDVLWLPQDSTTVDEATVLPLVLQEAWNRGMGVFSSSVAHVRRGALFALYPDNLELGRSLALSALGALASPAAAPRGLLPLKEVLIAVNLRTANHLGLQLGSRQQSFDRVFPEP